MTFWPQAGRADGRAVARARRQARLAAAVAGQPWEVDWRDHTLVPYARLRGWRVWFVQRSDASPAGWVDLVLARDGRVLFRELKADRGRLTAAQRECLHLLRLGGLDVSVWKPAMWSAIQDELE